ncbi:MarR family transcriptional regulator [Chakrabartyella piscis]|uniref:MarR family transcriptional regulator n=1 Tax=Chakrabartyella piscis TaxID=2918914 RepID=UPI002958B277|nr:MarR family transcriptional regulator [Chakrabartyella piscis]
MNRKLENTIKKFFHDMTIAELRLQNTNTTTFDLTYNDILYLHLIEAHSGEYTASKIADMLYVSRPAVTQKINELEKRGYILKKQSKEDKRIYYLYINPESFTNSYYKTLEKTDNEIIQKLSSIHSEKDVHLFCTMMDEISTILLNETQRGET